MATKAFQMLFTKFHGCRHADLLKVKYSEVIELLNSLMKRH